MVNALRPGAVKTEMTELEFGADHDWSGWTTPARRRRARRDAGVARSAPDFTGRVIDVGGFGKTWP